MNLDDRIRDKETSTGPFAEAAERSQAMKFIFRQGRNWDKMSIPNKEALENIATRLAMILSGDSNDHAHWNAVAACARIRGAALEPVDVQSEAEKAVASVLLTQHLDAAQAEPWTKPLDEYRETGRRFKSVLGELGTNK